MNMSSSTETIPTHTVQEFNLAPIPSPSTIIDVENTHMNMRTSTENTPSPVIEEFNPAPIPSPSTIPDLENTHMNTSRSTGNVQTPIIDEFNPAPGPSPTTIPGSSRIEKDIDSSPKTSQPSLLQSFGPQHVPAHLPGSANSEKEIDNSSVNSRLPGWQKFIPETIPQSSPHFPGNSACSSPQPSAPPGWEHTSPQPTPLEEFSGNTENVDISPNNSHPPPGWDDIVRGSAPPTPAIPGSSSIEKQKDMGSSPEISQPPSREKFSECHIPAPLPGMSQVVCGSCRQLLSYPQGITRVKCPCCQTINFVLEEHQVGTVKCAKCWVWLMYPHGAPSVKCSSCHFVTKIGEDNVRPPLSVQQNRSFVSPSPVQ